MLFIITRPAEAAVQAQQTAPGLSPHPPLQRHSIQKPRLSFPARQIDLIVSFYQMRQSCLCKNKESIFSPNICTFIIHSMICSFLLTHRLIITNIDVSTEMDDEEFAANWTQCVAF